MKIKKYVQFKEKEQKNKIICYWKYKILIYIVYNKKERTKCKFPPTPCKVYGEIILFLFLKKKMYLYSYVPHNLLFNMEYFSKNSSLLPKSNFRLVWEFKTYFLTIGSGIDGLQV